ncbi:MAG: hypothetical protein GXY41_11915 [Phycisphaerae bacterium]|nr:hypothetical protein [Phycisphaerae bacterium]
MNNCKTGLAWVLVGVFAVLVPSVQADTQEDRIERLEAQLAAMQRELALLKNQPSQPTAPASEQAINAAVDRAVEQKMAQQPKVPDWLSNMKLSGDFRYRHEWTDDASKVADRNRHRIQARIALNGTVNEELAYGFRLASGNSEAPLRDEGSPISHNQDLGNAFSSKNIWLDLAYFDYHPKAIAGLNVYGGKMNNPYHRVGNSDLMFDTDVTPEGIAAVYNTSLSETVNVFGAAGGYYVRERSEDADTSLWGIQGGATLKFDDAKKSHLTAGAGYYNYGNAKGRAGLGTDNTQFYGNRSTGGVFDSDFDLVQGFAEIGVPLGDLPLRLFADYICNTRAVSNQDTAYLIGASLGRTSTPGTWALSYNFRDVEADALLGVLAEAAFGGGGTNVKGHKFGVNYQLAKNTAFGLTYLMAERTRSGETNDFDMATVDFTLRF